MQERRLRLGDVLDDYCPREKRLTNHVIVALVGDEVRTTRCTTCDAEHTYKEGKVPVRRRKTETTASLYKAVLDEVAGDIPLPPPVPPPVVAVPAVVEPPVVAPRDEPPAVEPAAPQAPAEEPIHRHRLIRATLPRIEGQVPERKPADFTLWNVQRQGQGRRGRHRQAQGGNANWGGGYSPYANGHPSGKGPQQPQSPNGRGGRQNQRRGR